MASRNPPSCATTSPLPHSCPRPFRARVPGPRYPRRRRECAARALGGRHHIHPGPLRRQVRHAEIGAVMAVIGQRAALVILAPPARVVVDIMLDDAAAPDLAGDGQARDESPPRPQVAGTRRTRREGGRRRRAICSRIMRHPNRLRQGEASRSAVNTRLAGRFAAMPPLRARARPATSNPMIVELANPTRFMSLSGAICRGSAGWRRWPWRSGSTWPGSWRPPDYQQGETVRIMYPARAGGLARAVLLHDHGGIRARHARVAPSARGRVAEGGRPYRRRLHLHLPRHRLALGQAHVGHLLGLGCAAHLRLGAVPHVSAASSRCGAPSTSRPAPPARSRS